MPINEAGPDLAPVQVDAFAAAVPGGGDGGDAAVRYAKIEPGQPFRVGRRRGVVE